MQIHKSSYQQSLIVKIGKHYQRITAMCSWLSTKQEIAIRLWDHLPMLLLNWVNGVLVQSREKVAECD